ncbi:hypothetical protein AVEN_221784-1 [Araneus ventricosus]|uniref:Uncharacterized protein n=1 Tax=Araneus ventricosus TaxID=182803 RepID=A0A4Y2R0G3_ARAVE|nr:hypothetical protein AVEN_221784-1 [Araneus ventricosus]
MAESNSSALAHGAGEKGKYTMGTKEFIDQIFKWWNIVNVKNSEKGKRLKNPFCDPIRSKGQMSMVFLNKFYDWLASWNNKSALSLQKRKEVGLPGKGGKLSKETQFALQFTTKSLIGIVNHIFKEHIPEYILLETSVEFEVDEELYEVFDTTTDVEISLEEMPAFIYISGNKRFLHRQQSEAEALDGDVTNPTFRPEENCLFTFCARPRQDLRTTYRNLLLDE